jgi:urease accessory protein
MVAVGAWAAQSGRRASRALPAGFLVAMAAGAALAMSGLALPGVEVAIALSVLALGAAIAFAARPATWIAVALVAAFAVFHGHAHGGELLAGASALATASGFMLATATLHAIGLAGVALVARPAPRLARALGAAIALAGALLLAA